jgi:hypothetical protein
MALASSFFFYLSVPLFTPAAAACVMLESAGVGEASKGTAEARQCGEQERKRGGGKRKRATGMVAEVRVEKGRKKSNSRWVGTGGSFPPCSSVDRTVSI